MLDLEGTLIKVKVQCDEGSLFGANDVRRNSLSQTENSVQCRIVCAGVLNNGASTSALVGP